jgi:chromosomal replication initiator protein
MNGRPTIADCQRLVCRELYIARSDLMGARQARRLVRPRHIAMWLAVRTTGNSTEKIGKAFDRDHATVMHGHRVIEGLRRRCRGIEALTDGLLADLGWSA